MSTHFTVICSCNILMGFPNNHGWGWGWGFSSAHSFGSKITMRISGLRLNLPRERTTFILDKTIRICTLRLVIDFSDLLCNSVTVVVKNVTTLDVIYVLLYDKTNGICSSSWSFQCI